jgi:hypothetical protein
LQSAPKTAVTSFEARMIKTPGDPPEARPPQI